MDRKPHSEQDPRYHTQRVKGMFDELILHLREDIKKMDDPQAKAMFETSAEVISGLKRTFEHYEADSESAWKNS